MRGWLALAAIGVVVGGAWLYRRWWIASATEQFVTLTEKRHAELLDVERRQHEEG